MTIVLKGKSATPQTSAIVKASLRHAELMMTDLWFVKKVKTLIPIVRTRLSRTASRVIISLAKRMQIVGRALPVNLWKSVNAKVWARTILVLKMHPTPSPKTIVNARVPTKGIVNSKKFLARVTTLARAIWFVLFRRWVRLAIPFVP
jgi:hypothetical protein